MKKSIILLTFSIFFGNSCHSQKNYLSDKEELKINGINFNDIRDAKGNESYMKKLFGEDLNLKKSNEPTPRVSFWNDSFYCSFEGDESFNLVYLRIKKESDFLIKDKIIRLGDSINKLGEVKVFNNQPNNLIGLILFIPLEGNCDCSFSIQYNNQSKLIEKIEYNSW